MRHSSQHPTRGGKGTGSVVKPTGSLLKGTETVAVRRLDLRRLGRALLHAGAVGAAAGLAGCIFDVFLERTQFLVLAELTGFTLLRAAGEPGAAVLPSHGLRPHFLLFLPALGALLGGILLQKYAPEAEGDGADQTIDAFHLKEGNISRRVPLVKMLASLFTLGFGGSGGREEPIMLVGGAIGSVVSRYLHLTVRERRILVVAGAAAGIAAVFRTPLGAALFAAEVLYREDFESDALVPAVFASVVAYSVVVAFFGEASLFAHAARYPFIPAHLPLFALMAVLLAAVAFFFARSLRLSRRMASALGMPPWANAGFGGLLLGVLLLVVMVAGGPLARRGQELGLLGGGYGMAQVAITGAPWLEQGYRAVMILAVLALLKMVATGFTVGLGGSAGLFGPSFVVGGLLGGAFGRVAQLVLHDPRIDPGAYALVGMGAFYGGLAHAPIACLLIVCELAGSYDLLVPAMVAQGIAFVLLRGEGLYRAQVPTRRNSPAHRDDLLVDVLRGLKVADVMARGRRPGTGSIAPPSLSSASVTATNTAVPTNATGTSLELTGRTAIHATQDLHAALVAFLEQGVQELQVVDDAGQVVGTLQEADLPRLYAEARRGVDEG